MELMIVTVIIGILAMMVAIPVNNARENAQITSVRVELRHVMTAIEMYAGARAEPPGSLDELVVVGYEPAHNIAYCRFEVVDIGPPADRYVLLEAQHIATKTRLRTRYPGHSGFEEIPAAGVCVDLAEPIAGPPGRRVRRGWER